jgi:hypothetical protein
MSNKPGVLTWNMAFGFMLSYDWEGSGRNWQANRWLDLIGWLQRDVAAGFAGQPLKGYIGIAPRVTRTVFPSVTITANWSSRHAYTAREYGIAPQGFLAESRDGAVVAGSFAGRFNGLPLSRGTHYLILTRVSSGLVVRQPIGSDTPVRVVLPGRLVKRQLRVIACDAQDRPVGRARAAVRTGTVRFEYHQTIGRYHVAYYRVTDGARR